MLSTLLQESHLSFSVTRHSMPSASVQNICNLQLPMPNSYLRKNAKESRRDSMFVETKNKRPATPKGSNVCNPAALKTFDAYGISTKHLQSATRNAQFISPKKCKRIPKGFNVCRNQIHTGPATSKGSNVCNPAALKTCDAFGISTKHLQSATPNAQFISPKKCKRIPKGFNVCRNEEQKTCDPEGVECL